MNEQQCKYDEINLLDIAKVILKHKNFIIWFIIICVFVTASISLLMTNIYQAKAVITPVEQQDNARIGALGGIASQFGLSIGGSTKASEIVAQLNSSVIRESLIRKYNLLPVFFEPEELKDKTEKEQLWEGLRFLKDMLLVTNKEKDGVIEVAMDFKDPKIATNIVNWTLLEVTDRMSSDARRVANTNRKYLESIIDKTADPMIRTNIYNQIAQQIQAEMAAEAKENFAFKVIDPAKEPDKKTKPKRALMVIIAFVASLFVGIFIAFLMEFIEKNQQARVMLQEEAAGVKRLLTLGGRIGRRKKRGP
jgi:uncharacterized protein involved in exopolysaccharide biosynthesis